VLLDDDARLPRNRWAPWAGLATVVGYFGFVDLVEPSELPMLAAVAALYGAVLLSLVVTKVRRRLSMRRQIALLRGLSDASRAKVLSGLLGPVDFLLEREVSWHGRPVVEGLIERFSFSPVDRREARILAVLSWITAAALVVMAAALDLPVWATKGIEGLAIMSAIAGVLQRRRLEDLSRSFAVSPFGLSEVCGTHVRRVLWEMPIVLRNNRAAKRFELSLSGAPGHIDIPYTVVQVERLLTLIVENGGLSR